MRSGYAVSTMWRLVMVWMTRAWYNGGLSAEDERALDAEIPLTRRGAAAPDRGTARSTNLHDRITVFETGLKVVVSREFVSNSPTRRFVDDGRHMPARHRHLVVPIAS